MATWLRSLRAGLASAFLIENLSSTRDDDTGGSSMKALIIASLIVATTAMAAEAATKENPSEAIKAILVSQANGEAARVKAGLS